MVSFRSPVIERVRETVASGQTRYTDLLDSLDIPADQIDLTLMQLAKDGEVSLIAVGDALSVRGHGDREE